jgi:hypothetical protein
MQPDDVSQPNEIIIFLPANSVQTRSMHVCYVSTQSPFRSMGVFQHFTDAWTTVDARLATLEILHQIAKSSHQERP